MKRFLSTFVFYLTLFMGQSMAGIFNPEVHTLPNGLQIIVVPNDIAPIVSIGILYKVGTADDPLPLMGISHFLEHMMFKGTKTVSASEFKKIILRHGGSTNAATSFDYTIYETEIAKEYLELILKLEADRMANLSFTEEEIKSEKDVVFEERRMRVENHPFGQAYEVLLKALSWYHPYGIPPIGYPHHIQNYSFETVHNHYKTWYTPNNAIIIIAGKTSLTEVKPIVERYFGDLPSRTIPARQRFTEPTHQGITQHIEQKNPRNSLIMLNWYYNAPNHRVGETKHYYPLIVLSQILGGNSTTEFYRFLVEEKKLALSVRSSYEGDSYDPRSFGISATLSPNMDVAVFKKALSDYLKGILEKGVSEEELRKAKRDLLAQLAFIRDGNNSTLSVFTSLASGFSIEQIEKWADYIQAVTLEEVHAAAKVALSDLPVATMDLHPG